MNEIIKISNNKKYRAHILLNQSIKKLFFFSIFYLIVLIIYYFYYYFYNYCVIISKLYSLIWKELKKNFSNKFFNKMNAIGQPIKTNVHFIL